MSNNPIRPRERRPPLKAVDPAAALREAALGLN
jgi:hypothetical protein